MGNYPSLFRLKSLFLILFLVFIVNHSIEAQQFRFGPKAGMNLYSALDNQLTSADNRRTEMNLGIIAEIPLSGHFYLQPGIMFTQKHMSIERTLEDVQYTPSQITSKGLIYYQTNNLEIPVNILYKKHTGKFDLLGYAGPYVARILTGNMYLFDGVYGYDPVDAGLNFGAGVEYKNFQLTAQYSMDLKPLAPWESKSKYKILSLSLSYLFQPKGSKH